MLTISHLKLKFLAICCVGGFLVCGSLGFLCPMTIPSAEAASVPVHHGVQDEGACLDTLVTSAESSCVFPLFPVSPKLLHPGVGVETPGPLSRFLVHVHPHDEGPPRFLVLSTFLI